MSQIRLYTDEHVSKSVINALGRRGIDVLTTPEANMLGASDEEHLELARQEGRVIFTQDDDFLRLASEFEHAGIIYTPQETPLRVIISGILLVVQVLDSDEMHNHVEFI